jgi:hypothetical protein
VAIPTKCKRQNIKVDSSGTKAKVRLRKWLLTKMGFDEVYVLDTHTGHGKVWEAMEEHVTIRQWTKVDIQPKLLGTIKMDATAAVERLPIESYNVIDIDPYGEPWEPFMALLPRIEAPTAIFLTSCVAVNNMSRYVEEAVGIPPEWVPELPHGGDFVSFVSEIMLGKSLEFVNVLHAAKLRLVNKSPSRIFYYALGVEPK